MTSLNNERCAWIKKVELRKGKSRLNKTNVEVEKRMPMLNKRSTEFEKRRSYVKTTNKLNFDRKNAHIRKPAAFSFAVVCIIVFKLSSIFWGP